MGKFRRELNKQLKKDHPGYERALMQTYFTATEWRNVEMSEELGKFLQQGNAFYQFPFFKQIFTFWQVFRQSYSVAKQHHSHRDLILSEYMIMNLFIGVSTTLGFASLGVLSTLLSPFLKKKNETPFQTHVGTLVQDYAKFIHKVPFYNYPYLRKMRPLWRIFWQSENKTLADMVTAITASAELLFRAVLSWPIAWWYNQPQNQAADTIHLLVKTSKDNEVVTGVDERLTVVGQPYHHEGAKKPANYFHVTVPRYEAFAEVVHKLVENEMVIKNVANQDRLQFKLQVTEAQQEKLARYHVLYSYQNHVDKDKFVFIDVPTAELNDTVKQLAEDKIQIKLMHDF